jgi:hypothetical protein
MGAQGLSQDQKEKKVETLASFIKMIKDKGRSFLGNIITLCEPAAPMHTSETKSQSKQWLKKGKSGSIKEND